MSKTKTRIIKKYPNRRLYDTETSKYITLGDIRQLVIDDVDFFVKDVKTGDDLTRNILLQIIAEQEYSNDPFFSTAALSQIIRFYDDSLQGIAGDFIQKSLSLFVEQQKAMQDAALTNPLGAMNEIMERNVKLWKGIQKNLFNTVKPNRDKNK